MASNDDRGDLRIVQVDCLAIELSLDRRNCGGIVTRQ